MSKPPVDGPTIILSDTHLGRPRWAARSAESLRPIWQGASHLVINGDLAEVHHPNHWSKAVREVIQLFDLCEADGVRLTLLSGNHDPYITDLRHLSLADGAVFVTHGDVLHPAVAPWSPSSARMREAHEAALSALDPATRDSLESRLSASQLASHAEWEDLAREAGRSRLRGMLVRPWAWFEVFSYWRRLPSLAIEFLERHSPDARYMVIGHSHREGIWRIGTKTLINTGSFGFPGHPWVVRLAEGMIAVHRINRSRKGYEVNPAPVLREALEALPSAANTRPRSALPSTP